MAKSKTETSTSTAKKKVLVSTKVTAKNSTKSDVKLTVKGAAKKVVANKGAVKKSAAKDIKKDTKNVTKNATKNATAKTIKLAKAAEPAKLAKVSKLKKTDAAAGQPSASGGKPEKNIKLKYFSLPVTGKAEVLSQGKFSLKDLHGKITVLFFYPKDDTPGCTIEGQNFTALQKQFAAKGAQVFGVSRDTAASHLKFQSKCKIAVPLIADDADFLCQAFDVIKMKSMYGRQYEGIERSTFVLDQEGQVIHEWRKVSVPGHADEVLKFIQGLKT